MPHPLGYRPATISDIARGEMILKYGNEYYVDPCDEPDYDAIAERERENLISCEYDMNYPDDLIDDEPIIDDELIMRMDWQIISN